MAEEQKPAVATDAPAAEPAVAAPATETPATAATTEPTPETTTTTEAPATEPAAEAAAAPVEEPKAAEPAKKVAEPIYSGALGYKGQGLLKSLIFSKKYFWFGEEPVPASSLTSYLRGEKPDVAHPVVAWSSSTGKGLLYFAKHADDKKTPSGVLNLSEASDLKKEGTNEFSFKIDAHKHTFEAKQALERDGWFLALEKAVEEAKASSETVKSSEAYKEALEKLNKPAAVASAGATTAPKTEDKKSTEVKPAEGEARPQSSDEETPAKQKSKSKSRSVSRGKRASLFGSLLGKKDEVEAKKEEKKEEEAVKETPADAAAEPAVEAIAAEPVAAAAPIEPTSETTVAPVEEPKPVETAEAAPAAHVESAAETEATKPVAPKPSKRNSVIGNFFEKIRSPATEKKQSEIVPPVPAKDEPKEVKEAEAPAAEAAPAVEAAPTPAAESSETPLPAEPVEAKPTEAAPTTTPKKEKKGFSFGGVFGNKVKSPTTEKGPVVEAPKATDEAPKIEDAAPQIEETPKVEEAPKEEAPVAEAAVPVDAAEPVKAEETPATEAPKEKRKSSFFGNLAGKKDKKAETNGEVKGAEEKEKHPSKLSGLFRNPSKAVKSKKEKEVAPKTEETSEATKEEPAAEAIAEEGEKKEEKKETAAIGDVVPEAVTVGAPSSTPAVSTAA